MIIDPISIAGISDSNPIQFWAPGRETFNERKTKLVPKRRYIQKFDFNESLYNRLDVAFGSRFYPTWDVGTTYSIGDIVYDPVGFTRRVSTSGPNLGNNPFTNASDWAKDPEAWALNPPWDHLENYEAGQRVFYGNGSGFVTWQAKVDSIDEEPPSGVDEDDFWIQVQESNGLAQLRFWTDDVKYTLNFDNIRIGSKHQFVNFLWSIFPDLTDKTIRLDVYDPAADKIHAKSDCLYIYTFNPYPSVNIVYSNSDDYDGILYADVNPQYYIRINAVFETESHPTDDEDLTLTPGVIVSLRKKVITKKLLDIIEPMPEFMHRKIERNILTHDYVEIDELPYKKQDEYQRAPIKPAPLSTAQVLLTQANNVLVNVSKADIYSGQGVFSDEFSEPFA